MFSRGRKSKANTRTIEYNSYNMFSRERKSTAMLKQLYSLVGLGSYNKLDKMILVK